MKNKVPKVSFRFQFPIKKKEKFKKVCQENNLSMTDMILKLIQKSIEEDKRK